MTGITHPKKRGFTHAVFSPWPIDHFRRAVGVHGAMCVILLYVILLDRGNEEPCFSPSVRRFFKGWCLACILSTGASIAALLLFNQP